MKVAAIVVTHNSARFIQKAWEAFRLQEYTCEIIVVDSGSEDPSYFEGIPYLRFEEDIGFCAANNVGIEKAFDADLICFVNPDAFLTPSFLKEGVAFMEAHPTCGAVTGITYGYDIENDLPKEAIDSTGIFQTWYGHWYDRRDHVPHCVEEVPAICGAVMLCRKEALEEVRLGNGDVFDSSFFMYKEDIDLSVRLRKKGWKVMYTPKMLAYHCRGWKRSSVPRRFRLLSARNEVRLHWKLKSPVPLFYSLLKLLSVRMLNV